jgi:phage terminase Nu1 subunit (DNA packaging protein)
MKKRIYTADLAALLNVSLRTLSRLSSRGLAPEPVGRSHRGGHYWLAGDPALKRFIADQRRPGRAADARNGRRVFSVSKSQVIPSGKYSFAGLRERIAR